MRCPFGASGSHDYEIINRIIKLLFHSLKYFGMEFPCLNKRAQSIIIPIIRLCCLFFLCTGSSDPYVKVKIGDKLYYKTKTIYRDLNPFWDEAFVLPINDLTQPVMFKVGK